MANLNKSDINNKVVNQKMLLQRTCVLRIGSRGRKQTFQFRAALKQEMTALLQLSFPSFSNSSIRKPT